MARTKTFDLLSLPPELRREIYRHYFVSTGDPYSSLYNLIEEDKDCNSVNIYCLKQCRTQILTINRQVYLEARDVLYSDTTWHISFNSSFGGPYPKSISDVSLQAFRSRPEFQCLQHVTVGVMFNTSDRKTPTWTPDDSHRLKVNEKLLDLICETLLLAPNLLTLKVLWHDRMKHGVFSKKCACLQALARLPDKVKCAVFLGLESTDVHFPHQRIKSRGFSKQRGSLSAEDEAVKADLNRHLNTIRHQYQARKRAYRLSRQEKEIVPRARELAP